MSDAPRALRLVEDFVNTLQVDTGADDLGTPAGLRSWLVARGLLRPEEAVSAADVEAASGLRETIRALLIANHERRTDLEANAALNAHAASAPLVLSIDDEGRPGLQPEGGGAVAALGHILGRVFTSMAEGSWARLKACGSASCQWAFYDASKNRSANWCSMAVCGNRAKARAYRRRRRAEG